MKICIHLSSNVCIILVVVVIGTLCSETCIINISHSKNNNNNKNKKLESGNGTPVALYRSGQ